MTTRQRVEAILSVSRAARNSDKELLILFMQKAGMELRPSQIEIFRELNMESIRRERQKLQEKGLYRADEAVNESRYNKYKNVRENIDYKDPSELIEASPKAIPWMNED